MKVWLGKLNFDYNFYKAYIHVDSIITIRRMNVKKDALFLKNIQKCLF